MAQGGRFVTLGELLEEDTESERDKAILERIKLLAQEHLPEGWTDWKVIRASRDEVFCGGIDPQLLNKLRFALPTVGLAKAFDPELDHLSERGFRELKVKLLDWEFARALIMSPPSVSNRIRGSAVQTEIFNKAVASLRPLLLSRSQADRILSGEGESIGDQSRRRRSSSSGARSSQPGAKKAKVDVLEKRMEDMFSILMEKIESLKASNHPEIPRNSGDESDSEGEHSVSDVSELDSEDSRATWRAPDFDHTVESALGPDDQLEFLPRVKEAEPLVPEPNPQIRNEGIECQRLGKEGWSRIRYKEVEKALHAAPVFSALKVNMELGGQGTQISPLFARQDGILGTITHGLLLQRKALAEELKRLAKDCPSAAEGVRKVLAEESPFKVVSDNLLQYVCAHRAGTIEIRRKAFKAKNETLSMALHQIPPSESHLFEVKALSAFVKDNGGVNYIFPARFGRFPEKRDEGRDFFRKPTPAARTTKSKQPTWRTRANTASGQSSAPRTRARKTAASGAQARQRPVNTKPSRRTDGQYQRGRKY